MSQGKAHEEQDFGRTICHPTRQKHPLFDMERKCSNRGCHVLLGIMGGGDVSGSDGGGDGSCQIHTNIHTYI